MMRSGPWQQFNALPFDLIFRQNRLFSFNFVKYFNIHVHYSYPSTVLTKIYHSHRIDTRPEGTLLCVLAEGKRPKFFYVLWRHPGVHTALCTYVFLWKLPCALQDGVIWWRIFTSALVKFRTKYRLSDTSGPVSILCHSIAIFTLIYAVECDSNSKFRSQRTYE
jgi:hypothetical protein